MGKQLQTSDRLTLRLSYLAAIAYNTWPLAYACNRMVLQHGLASDLDKFNQPFSWVFISGDFLSGIILMFITFLQFRAVSYRLLRLLIVAYGLSGLVIVAAAITPIKCVQVADMCVEKLTSPAALVHSILSIASIVLLSYSVLFSLILRRVTGSKLRQLWLIILTAVLMLLFGTAGLIDILHGNNHNELQYIFIVITGLAMVVSVSSAAKLIDRKPPHLTIRTLHRSIRAGRSFYP